MSNIEHALLFVVFLVCARVDIMLFSNVQVPTPATVKCFFSGHKCQLLVILYANFVLVVQYKKSENLSVAPSFDLERTNESCMCEID